MPRELHGDGVEEAELASWGQQNRSPSTALAEGPGRAQAQRQPSRRGMASAGVHNLLEAFVAQGQCSFTGHFPFDPVPVWG